MPLGHADARRRAAVAACAASLAFAALTGCAKREPPTGGPLDIEAPRVTESFPDSGAARVPRGARLSLTFSETMEPRATGDGVALAPRIEIRQKRWSGHTVTLVLAESLAAHQTYTLFLGGDARDLHGNRLENGKAIVFSTADTFPTGGIEGEIEARGFSPAGTYLWCYNEASGHVPDSTARDFDAVGLADRLGHFRIAGLAVPRRYRLWAFADLNGNRSFEPSSDILAPVDTVFDLSPDRPLARNVHILVINPRAPGRVRGVVLDSLADSLGTSRVLVFTPPDTSRALQFDADVDGVFEIRLPPGRYVLRAYRDLDRSHNWQPEHEPASDLREVTVPPAADVLNVRLNLRRPKGRP